MSRAGIGPRVVSLMELAAGFQARVRLDEEAVADYAAVLSDGGRMPPIVVFLDESGVMRVGDGHHRVAAAREAGLRELPADVREGSERDARHYALFRANRMNGLRMTSEDKRKAVHEALVDPEWGAWSDRQIAKEMSVSHTFVGKVRQELTGNVASEKSPSQRTYTTRHGTKTVMDTSNIGRRQEAARAMSAAQQAPAVESDSRAPALPPVPAEPSEAEQVAQEAHGDIDPMQLLDETQHELEAAQKTIAAMREDDKAAAIEKWQRLADVAQRRQGELQDAVKKRDDELKWYQRQLTRICKAVGEDDPAKVAAVVEAMVRRQKVAEVQS